MNCLRFGRLFESSIAHSYRLRFFARSRFDSPRRCDPASASSRVRDHPTAHLVESLADTAILRAAPVWRGLGRNMTIVNISIERRRFGKTARRRGLSTEFVYSSGARWDHRAAPAGHCFYVMTR